MANIKGVDKIILATSTDSSDDCLANYLADNGFTVFRGSLENVPLRMYECAKYYSLDHIVRITGDCVFLDFDGMSSLLEEHLLLSPDVSILMMEYLEPARKFCPMTINFLLSALNQRNHPSILNISWKRPIYLKFTNLLTIKLASCY